MTCAYKIIHDQLCDKKDRHDCSYCLTVTGNHGDDDRGAGGRTLDENGEEDADHQSNDRVCQQTVGLEHAA